MWHTLTKSLWFKHINLIELPWRRRSAAMIGDTPIVAEATINRTCKKKVFQSELSGVELQVDWAFHGNVLPLQGCPSSSGVSLKLYNLTAWVWEWARIMHFSSCTMLWKNKTEWSLTLFVKQQFWITQYTMTANIALEAVFLLFSWIKPWSYSHPTLPADR